MNKTIPEGLYIDEELKDIGILLMRELNKEIQYADEEKIEGLVKKLNKRMRKLKGSE